MEERYEVGVGLTGDAHGSAEELGSSSRDKSSYAEVRREEFEGTSMLDHCEQICGSGMGGIRVRSVRREDTRNQCPS